MSKWWRAVVVLGMLVCLAGCQTFQKMSVEDQAATVKMWTDAGKDAGLDVSVFIDVPSEGYLKQAIGHNGRAVIFMRGNPGD